MKTAIGLLAVGVAIFVAGVIMGSPGKRLYEQPAAMGDRRP